MLVIDNKFELYQTVYLITDELQKQRMVVSIRFSGGNLLFYLLAQETDTSWHCEAEITTEKTIK